MSGELQTCLEALAEEVIKRIGSHHSLSEPSPAILTARLTDQLYLQSCLNEMPAEERAVLLYFLFASKNGAIKEREIAKEQHKLGIKAFRRQILKLCQKGWMFPLRNSFHERLYYIPAELRRAWIQALDAKSVLKPVSSFSVRQFSEPSVGIWQAFFHFLCSLEHEPWLLTKTGQIPKKEAQKLDVELDLDTEALRKTKWGSQDELPPWISFLIELGQLLGLVEVTNQYLEVRRVNWYRWIRLPFSEMMEILYQAVFQLLTGEGSGMHGYLQLMECLEAETWYSLRDIAWYLLEFDFPFFTPEIQDHLENQLIDPLVAMGWLEKGKADPGETYIRWLGLPPKSAQLPDEVPFYIEPHLEIYLPYYFPLQKRYVLAQVADFMGGDQMLIYELNERSIQRARRYGLTGEEILSLLAAWSGTEVPKPVQEQVMHWFRQSSSILVEPVFLLHVSPERMRRCRQILKRNGIKVLDLSGERLAISAADLDAAKAAMREDGQEVEQMHHPFPGNDERVNRGSDWFALLSPLREWRVEARYPEEKDLRSGGGKLPALWTSGLRAYGPEMMREIVKQSIHYGLFLQVEYQGELSTVSPLKIEFCSGDWLMHAKAGREKKCYPLGQVKRMQVLVDH
jgi:hypothetical protein